MKTKIAIIALAVFGAAFFSCSRNIYESAGTMSLPEEKILNTRSSDTEDHTLLVKFATVPSDSTLAKAKVDGVATISKVIRGKGGSAERLAKAGLDRWYKFGLEDNADIEAVATSLSSFSEIEAVEYSMLYYKASDGIAYPLLDEGGSPVTRASSSTPFNDPNLHSQWNYYNSGDVSIASSAYAGADINVYDVWETLTCGDSDIIVAVIDEGIKYTHPDLAANIWTNPNETENGTDSDGNGYVDDIHGYNFVTGGPITWGKANDTGHATHCAGTIAAVNNNGIGVCGVAGGSGNGDGVKLMSCQIFDDVYTASSASVAEAFVYAADMGASVISCSFGYTSGAFKSDSEYKNGNYGTCLLEYEALCYFESTKNNSVLDGGIAVFAAGNDSQPYSTYPGALNDIISVSAYAPDFLPTYYTNYGAGCNVTAPGGEAYLRPWTSYAAFILSTLPSESNDGSDYGYMQGTSMACPHVSGIVALGLAYAKKLGKTYSVSEFKQLVLSSTDDIDTRISRATKDYATSRTLNLTDYRKKMGTGAIDAWRLMMQIEGVPCLPAVAGEEQWLDLTDYFGSASINLTYLNVEYSDATKQALGLADEPYINYGRLFIYPTKCGSGKFTVTAVGGGEEIGGDDAIGGMELNREVSVIVRSVKSSNGGWL